MNLLHAAEYLDLELAKKFLDAKADINESDDFGQIPLHIAIDSTFEESIYIDDTQKRMVEPKLDFIEFLISHGADYNKPDNKGRSPIDWAIGRKNELFIEKLKKLINK